VSVHQLKVMLQGVRPPIWRRFQVPGQITLDRLHLVLLAVMGWDGGHLHVFEVGGRRIGEPDDAYGDRVEDGRRVALDGVAAHKGARLTYIYDFGDDWRHQLLVEKADCPAADERRVVCLAGRRACPPEDCGGLWGYCDLLDAMADPTNRGWAERLQWLKEVHGDYDPEEFDPAEVTARLARFDPLARSRRLSLGGRLTG
jgi:hypothetical protein